jgi:glutathione synthase/RimK-type ligase-like ATP-grasp enzyme
MAHVALVTEAASRARAPEARAMRAYAEGAPSRGHSVEVIDVADFHRIPEFDAVFLRLDTNVLGLSFAASRYAWGLGLRVVDDPRSILTCMNKAHTQGLLERAGVPTPETILLTRAGKESLDADAVFQELGSPVVVKAPSGAFSSAVEMARDAEQLRHQVTRFASRSDVVLLQRFVPSAFDWRVGVLGGELLYACRYRFPKGGWRVRDKAEGEGRMRWARIEPVPLAEVPELVLETGLLAANAVGTGLYGVDIKEREDGSVVVIEVNDNPNIDYDGEIAADSPLWAEIIDRVATRGPRA